MPDGLRQILRVLLRQRHGKRGFPVGTGIIYAAMMQLDDPLHDGKADPVALRGVGLVCLVEFLEDAVSGLRRDGLAVIRNCHMCGVWSLVDFNAQLRAEVRELDGVVQQIDPDIDARGQIHAASHVGHSSSSLPRT